MEQKDPELSRFIPKILVSVSLLFLAGFLYACSPAKEDQLTQNQPSLPAEILLPSSTRETNSSPIPTPTQRFSTHTPTQNPVVSITPVPTTSPVGGIPTSSVTEDIVISSPTATATSRPPKASPTPSSTPTIPPAEIEILSPGPASKVVSPLMVSAYLMPGAKGNVRIELLGEDGRLLVRKLLNFFPGVRVRMGAKLDFETPAVAEAGRLQIITEDRYGRVIAMASSDVLLLSIGEDDLNQPGDLLENIVIREPIPNRLVQGGNVIVSGLARVSGNNPLVVEMIGTDGQRVGSSRLVSVAPDPDGKHSPFVIDVPYSVNKPTWVRLTVSVQDGRIPGVTHLSSVEILLSP